GQGARRCTTCSDRDACTCTGRGTACRCAACPRAARSLRRRCRSAGRPGRPCALRRLPRLPAAFAARALGQGFYRTWVDGAGARLAGARSTTGDTVRTARATRLPGCGGTRPLAGRLTEQRRAPRYGRFGLGVLLQ